MTVTPETAADVTNNLQTILSNPPPEDQTADNVAIVADVLSSMSVPDFQINEEVCIMKLRRFFPE